MQMKIALEFISYIPAFVIPGDALNDNAQIFHLMNLLTVYKGRERAIQK